ncbi:MAG: TetR/AcrR family transcriptional regulator [Pseudomonadota bacterium]
MARPRKFDEQDVIDRAMIAFWQNGYDATAIGDLEAATGISRISIYNTFGDKEGLFLRALDSYHNRAIEIFQDGLAADGLDAIAAFFDRLSEATPQDSPANFGCLMVNTVLDIRSASAAVQDRVQSYRAMIKGAFASALQNARRTGEMRATDAVIDDRAEYLVGVLWGALATIRVQCRTVAAAPLARVTADVINGWRE